LLADQVAHLGNCRSFATDRLRVLHGQCASAAESRTATTGCDSARNNHHQVGTKAFDLLAHGLVGALSDGDHSDQRCDTNEHPQHRQAGARLVTPDRLGSSHENHQPEGAEGRRGRRGDGESLGRLKERSLFAACLRYGRRQRSFRLYYPLVGDDPAVAHRQDATRKGGDVGLVSDDDDGQALFAIERGQCLHDLVRRARIEIAGRLVCKQEARRVDQSPGDRDALLLAAGELAGRVALALAEAENPQCCPRPLQPRRSVSQSRSRVVQRQPDILDRTGAG